MVVAFLWIPGNRVMKSLNSASFRGALGSHSGRRCSRPRAAGKDDNGQSLSQKSVRDSGLPHSTLRAVKRIAA